MDTSPSLLDWLKAYWSRPVVQRAFRFGLAALSAGWGLYLQFGQANGSGYFFLGLAIGLAFWGFSVRAEGGAMPEGLPQVNLARAESATAPIQINITPLPWLAALRLPAAFVFPLIGQYWLNTQRENWSWGVIFYLLGLASFGLVVWHEKLLLPPSEAAQAASTPARFRVWLVGLAAVGGVLAYFASSGNRFTQFGVIGWIVGVIAIMASAWEGSLRDTLLNAWERLRGWAARGFFQMRVSHIVLLFLAVLSFGAYFRFADLNAIPPEMTSDHVEKLMDVGDLAGGQTKIYFERNTGREPFQFYWTAWLAEVFGTGITFLSLKIGTALLGFLTLPSVYLLARELEDDDYFALIATALVAVSFWATATSRVGLRFPLYPVFVAPTLYFLVRGLRRNTRNDFLWAGFWLGAGLYGYSPIRILPFALLVIVGVYLLSPAARGRRRSALVNTALLFVVALFVFLPLLRYATETEESRNMFWYRTASRLAETEAQIANSGPALQLKEWWAGAFGGAAIPMPILQALLFLQNNWNALLMFNFKGDQVWVNTLPGKPVLDLFSAAVWILGLGYVLARAILKRDWKMGALLLAIPVLLLPSTLSLAFPDENPSVVRTGGAIPLVFIVAAYPLWLLVKRARTLTPGASALGAGALTLAVFLGGAAVLNRDMYFKEYPSQYIGGAQNASEIGTVIHDFARSFGTYDTAWVRPYPFWVDTRAVGMYSGNFWRDYAIQYEDLAATVDDPRAKLFILHRHEGYPRSDGIPSALTELRRLYPDGQLSVFTSARPDHDFLIFFVPAQADVDESELPPP
jgi:hypothetical protein